MLETLKNIITRNFAMKLVSVFIAIVLWLMINAVIDPVQVVTVKNIPVSLANEEDLTSAGQLVEIVSGNHISVKVRAKRSVAEKLTAEDFNAIADATDINEYHSVPIKVKCQTYGENEVEIISHITEEGTSTVHLSLEEIHSQSFAVTVINDGTVKDGYYIFSSEVSPNLITIQGTQTQLSKIAKVAVIANVEGISADTTQSCSIMAYDKDNAPVSLEKMHLAEDHIRVDMHVVRTKEIEVKVELNGTPAEGYVCDTVEYAPHYITVAGNDADLAGISSITVKCMISESSTDVEKAFNIAEIVKDLYQDKLKVVNEAQTISVRAVVEQESERMIDIAPEKVTIRKLDAEYTVEIKANVIPVTLKGKKDVLDALTEDDIKVSIECSMVNAPGAYNSVPLIFETPEGVRAARERISIEVKRKAAPLILEENEAE